MAEIGYDHPLKLPPNWTVTPLTSREFCRQFPANIELDDAIRFLEDEITALGMTAPVIYTNSIALNNPRLRKIDTRLSGVTIQFGTGKNTAWLACDKWQSLEQNLYALHLTIRALRNIESWGIAPAYFIIQAISTENTATGYSSSTGHSTSQIPDWMAFLGLGHTAELEDANAVYRRRAKTIAGDEDALIQLNQAMDEARKSLR